MKKNNFKQIIMHIFFYICVLCILISCDTKSDKKNLEKNTMEEMGLRYTAPTKKWQESDERIALVLGLGYTEEHFVHELLSVLGDAFGLDCENGLIYPLLFPDDFVYNGVKGRISSLPDILMEKKLRAVYIVGAPEGTHRALATMQDKKERALDIAVFSLFPQDDVLGIESGSDIVIDFGQFYSPSPMSEEGGLEHLSLVPEILHSLIKKESLFDRNFSSKEKKTFLEKSLGLAWNVETSVDLQTGLRSKNHFDISLIEEYSDAKAVVDSLIIIDKSTNKN